MGSLLRSEPMQLIQLFVQVEAAHDTVDELGKLGLVEFRDLNPQVNAFQRNFVNDVKKSDEMERKLRFFREQVDKEKKDILAERGLSTENLDLIQIPEAPPQIERSIDELETQFDDLEKELQQMNSNQEMLTKNYNELIELKHVLTKDSAFFSEVSELSSEVGEGQSTPLLSPDTRNIKLGFVTGVIPSSKFIPFERVLWRATRGNLYLRQVEVEDKIKDPQTGDFVDKNVFIIFYQGERSQLKIKKICESFGANLYPCPQTPRERKDLLSQVINRLADLETVLERTKKHRRQVLFDLAKQLKGWDERVRKEKSIYHTMNLFNYDIGRKCLIAEGWCPQHATERIVNALRVASERSGAMVPSILTVVQSNEEPPTLFRTNKFSKGFQAIVDAYGVPRYGEVNPGVFTIITFPFLFGVMFGDFGHGLLMTMFAAYLILKEVQLGKKNLNELIQVCFDGRYMLLLMGIFAMYNGLIYNECFAVPMDIFGSNYEFKGNDTVATIIDPNYVYPFGVDPAWVGAYNSLNYYNSLKMKLSLILGVAQMTMGIFVSLMNALHFKKYVNIYGEFIPQILFLLGLFGYMDFLIFLKWSMDWSTRNPPFLLNVMINMFLKVYTVEDSDKLFDGQLTVQWILIFLAVVSVPWMLLVKPFVLKRRYKARLAAYGGEDEHEEAFDFGEIMVKQIIHTIEFVLGAISNTASYLRLWALSLAHSQLSQVFWERVMIGIGYDMLPGPAQFVFVFFAFGAWAGVTIGVLMIMESLSAFLHALRLHWVEFQNKFYEGDGRAFNPYSYQRILSGEEEQ